MRKKYKNSGILLKNMLQFLLVIEERRGKAYYESMYKLWSHYS